MTRGGTSAMWPRLKIGAGIAFSTLVAGACLLTARRLAGISRSTFRAGGFLFGSWSMHALVCTLLLSAPGDGFSPYFALVVICLAAATSVLPITAGCAIVNIGTTSAALLALDRSPRTAINFSPSGMLPTLSALVAAMVGAAASIALTIQRRHLVHATPL